MLCYNLEDFKRIETNSIPHDLNISVHDMIKIISDQVSDPEYSKTPQFNKKKRGYHTKYNVNDTRNFKITEKKTITGIELSLNTIRKYLNKLSNKTYDKLSQEIIQEITGIVECDTIPSTNAEATHHIIDDMRKVGVEIFNIASSGTFYSAMYAKLYHELMENFEIMKTIFTDNFTTFREVFHNIEYCDPNTDYDKFCENNKANQKRRGLAMFYVNLMKLDALSHDSIIDIITDIQSYMKTKIVAENMASIVEELSEVVAILVLSSKDILCEHHKWQDIIGYITVVSSMKASNAPSLTHKTIFKHMDILDGLK